MKKINTESKLTKFVKAAGWAAKLAPGELSQTLLKLGHNNVLLDFESSDDASVIKINDDLALLQTVDFITPVADNPYIYGQIAAANSLSDIFAMGGEVISALNIVGFDNCNHKIEILSEILAGGQNKINECNGALVGGHTIASPEMYYGLSVLGKVHPKSFWRNNTPKIGDVLILTKPLGMGVLATAIKADFLNYEEMIEALDCMAMLNYNAMRILKKHTKVSACTDITGFGFLGHALEMINDNISLVLQTASIPILKSAITQAQMGIIPAGSYLNKDHVLPHIDSKNEVDILLCDSQTSGGLLVSINEKDSKEIVKRMVDAGYTHCSIVGEVKERNNQKAAIILN